MQFQINAGEIFFPCHGMWLFYLYSTLKIQVLSKFSLRDSIIEAFFGGFLWSFKK